MWLVGSNPVGRGGAGRQQPNRVRLEDCDPCTHKKWYGCWTVTQWEGMGLVDSNRVWLVDSSPVGRGGAGGQ